MDFKEKVDYYNQKRIDGQLKVEATMAEIRRRNKEYGEATNLKPEEHLTVESTEVTVYDSADYNPAYYVLSYLNPPRRKKK